MCESRLSKWLMYLENKKKVLRIFSCGFLGWKTDNKDDFQKFLMRKNNYENSSKEKAKNFKEKRLRKSTRNP